MTSFSLGKCSGKASLGKRHSCSKIKDVFINHILGRYWDHSKQRKILWQEEACCQHVGLRYREPEYSISCGWKGLCGQTRQHLLGPAEDLGLYSGSNEKSLKVFNQRGYEQ